MCVMCWCQHALLDAILKILNGLSVSEMVGPGMHARNYNFNKQLLMSVGDRENYKPCFGKLCGASEENVCQVKIAVKHQRRYQPGRIQKNDLAADLQRD